MEKNNRKRLGIVLYGVKSFFNMVALFTGWVFIFMSIFGYFNPLAVLDGKYNELKYDFENVMEINSNLNKRLNECVNITNPKFVDMVIKGLEEHYENKTKYDIKES